MSSYLMGKFTNLNPCHDKMCYMHSTYQTTLVATPGQLVLSTEMLLNIDVTANWDSIYISKQIA